MSNPMIQVDDEIREMTDEEVAQLNLVKDLPTGGAE